MKIVKNPYCVISFLIFLVFLSCKKEIKPEQTNNIIPTSVGYGDTINYYNPCFNPNNSDEFVFVKTNAVKGNWQLIKHSLSNNTNTLIANDMPIQSGIKWGKNGWLLFAINEIFIVKENGGSMIQVTHGNPNTDNKSDACFTLTNDIFYYFSYEDKIKKVYFSGNKIINLNGILTDSIDNVNSSKLILQSDINAENMVVGTLHNETIAYIRTYDIPSRNFKDIKTFIPDYPNNRISGICWHPDNQDIIYSMGGKGIFRINKNSGNEILITNGGPGFLGGLTISPDGKKIIYERKDITYLSNGDYLTKNILMMVNIDGSGMEKLDL